MQNKHTTMHVPVCACFAVTLCIMPVAPLGIPTTAWSFFNWLKNDLHCRIHAIHTSLRRRGLHILHYVTTVRSCQLLIQYHTWQRMLRKSTKSFFWWSDLSIPIYQYQILAIYKCAARKLVINSAVMVPGIQSTIDFDQISVDCQVDRQIVSVTKEVRFKLTFTGSCCKRS